MARKNPLAKIKDLTVETLKSPKDAARQAVGQARGAASMGRHLAGQATSMTAGAVGKLVQGKKLKVDSPAPTKPVSTDEPVNVTEKLGLDPAPVAKPRATPSDKPVTSIDAQAEPGQVAVTPADIAAKVSKKAPARKPAARKAPAAKKAAARKTAPGAKLPPRKKVEVADKAEASTDAAGSDKG